MKMEDARPLAVGAQDSLLNGLKTPKQAGMLRVLSVCMLMLMNTSCNRATDPSGLIGLGHVDANAPADADFDKFLTRDLAVYFTNISRGTGHLEYVLLRQGATQSGVAYPKYYAWVNFRSPNGESREGAVRVAAIDQNHFEVTHFLTWQQIKADPHVASDVFPAPLVPEISRRAALATSTQSPSPQANASRQICCDPVTGDGVLGERST
jgi:hypothetical protein